MGISDEKPLVERYDPVMKRMDDIVQGHREKFGPDWPQKIGLRVVTVPPTIDQKGNKKGNIVGGMDESFFRPPWVK